MTSYADNILFQLMAVSPVDGRYGAQTQDLADFFSEYALIRRRLTVELRYLIALSDQAGILRPLTQEERGILSDLETNFSLKEAARIKEIERTTNHDVKAIEYFIKENLENSSLNDALEMIHFALTSEDVNNLSYGLMIMEARQKVMLPAMRKLINRLSEMAREYRAIPLLSHTHGQPASPTTMGKEIALFVQRLRVEMEAFANTPVHGKLNGAVGNFNAHLVAYQDIDWLEFSRRFILTLGLTPNPFTTQIEQHDALAMLCDALRRFNTVLLGLDQDLWRYISDEYFTQTVVAGEIGSSTMPNKVNPIDFENSEGNLGLANALLIFFSTKLPVSRMQRDLTDSTVQRNLGVAFAHTLLAYRSTSKGLNKLVLNRQKIEEDLAANWAVVAEGIQTILRTAGVARPYELLKELTRGKEVTAEDISAFIDRLDVDSTTRARLKRLSPFNYIGEAVRLTDLILGN